MKRAIGTALTLFFVTATLAVADDPITAETVQSNLNFIWTLVAAFLVFFMQAGFAMVEAGFTRAKNCCNIIMKNLMDFGVGAFGFFVLGFGLMFGVSSTGWFGSSSFMLADFAVDADL